MIFLARWSAFAKEICTEDSKACLLIYMSHMPNDVNDVGKVE